VREVQLGDDDPVVWMIKAAVLRRHLSDDQRAMMAALYAKANPQKEGRPSRKLAPTGRQLPTGKSTHVAAQQMNVAPKRAEKAARVLRANPQLASKVHAGELRLAQAVREVHRGAQLQAIEAAGTVGIELRDCDIREADVSGDAYADVANVHAIITDPPYGDDHLPLYHALARFAQRVLRTDGICAVMTGHLILPDVINVMRAHVPYRWVIAYLTPGGQSAQIFPAKVNTFWKPVVLFGAASSWIGDVVRSATNDNDKRFHRWGQSESGIRDLVERLTSPGDLVCDPFLGGGTTAAVCRETHRRFVGGDIDGDAVQRARARCSTMTMRNPSDPSVPAGETPASVNDTAPGDSTVRP
jgi:site-specific DNA-methyltransferase (adenine-specific)